MVIGRGVCCEVLGKLGVDETSGEGAATTVFVNGGPAWHGE